MSYPTPNPIAFHELIANEAPVEVHGFDPTTVGRIAERWAKKGTEMLSALANESRRWKQNGGLDEDGHRRQLWSWYYLRLLAAELPPVDVAAFRILVKCELRFDQQTPTVGEIVREWVRLFVRYPGLEREMRRRIAARRSELQASVIPNEAALWKWLHKEYSRIAADIREEKPRRARIHLRIARPEVSFAGVDEDRLPDFFVLAEYCVVAHLLPAIQSKSRGLGLSGVPPIEWAAHYFHNVQAEQKLRLDTRMIEAAVIYHADELYTAAERMNLLGRRLAAVELTPEVIALVRRKFARHPGLELAAGDAGDTARKLKHLLELNTFLEDAVPRAAKRYEALNQALDRGPALTAELKSLQAWLLGQERSSTAGFRALLQRLSRLLSAAEERTNS